MPEWLETYKVNITQRTMMATAMAVTLSLDASIVHAQTVIFVDDNAQLGGDGTSWDMAYAFLQDALATAQDGYHIRVADGLYKPDADEAGVVSPGDREATFWLRSNVAILGGYRGCPGTDCTAADADTRDYEKYKTVLTGDLNGGVIIHSE